MSTENQPSTDTGTEKRKLTDQQLRIAQIVAGIICAAALVVSIYLSGLFGEDNTIMQYLFLIVFVVIMVGRRQIEKRFRLRLNLFSLAMIDGIAVGIIIYTATAFFTPAAESAEQAAEGAETATNTISGLSDPVKILILAGIFVLMLVFGIILPLRRYYKRKAEGNEIPIRLPEPEEEPEPEEAEDMDDDTYHGMSPIERQIMEMTKELDNPDSKTQNDEDEQK